MISENIGKYVIAKNIQDSKELGECILNQINPEEILRYKNVGATNVQVFKLLHLDKNKKISAYLNNHTYINNSSEEHEIKKRKNKIIEGGLSYIVNKFASKVERNLYMSKIRKRYKRQGNQRKILTTGQYKRTRKRESKLRYLCKIHRTPAGYIDRKKVIAEYIASGKIKGYENAEKIVDYNIRGDKISTKKSRRNTINERPLRALISQGKEIGSKFGKYHGKKRVLHHEMIIYEMEKLFPELAGLTKQIRKLKIQRELDNIMYPNKDKPKQVSIRKGTKAGFVEIIMEGLKKGSKYGKYNAGKRCLNYDTIIPKLQEKYTSLVGVTDKSIWTSKIQYEAKKMRKSKKYSKQEKSEIIC